jgi:PAS domain S-box-containing protein
MNSMKDDPASLRVRAAAFLAAHPNRMALLSPTEALQELQVHQVELEMQNQELRETQTALARARDRYFSLFDLAPVPYLVFDARHHLTELNLAAAELLGRERAWLKSRPFAPYVSAESRDLFHGHLNLTFETGRRQVVELRLNPEGGLARHVQLVSLTLPAEPELPAICLTSCVDLTERKAAEEALRGAKDQLARINLDLEQKVHERTAELEESIGELEQFSYTITHDMRAPLRAIQGLGSLLRVEYTSSLGKVGQEYVRRISDAASRMDKLITDALQYSHAVRNRGLSLEPVDPNALLKGIVESYPQFHPPNAQVEIEGRLPWLLGNEAAMTQCFSNLLGNAVKFVAPGQLPVVRIRGEHRGERVRLWFEDNGIGIDPKYHDKIWVMFQRLHSSYEGTGIGLALVRKVVERMGGRVGVESELGCGSRFWIDLKTADSVRSSIGV